MIQCRLVKPERHREARSDLKLWVSSCWNKQTAALRSQWRKA